jgi:hypothetical protein
VASASERSDLINQLVDKTVGTDADLRGCALEGLQTLSTDELEQLTDALQSPAVLDGGEVDVELSPELAAKRAAIQLACTDREPGVAVWVDVEQGQDAMETAFDETRALAQGFTETSATVVEAAEILKGKGYPWRISSINGEYVGPPVDEADLGPPPDFNSNRFNFDVEGENEDSYRIVDVAFG